MNPDAAVLVYSHLSDYIEERERAVLNRLVAAHRGSEWDDETVRALVAEISALRTARDAAKREMRAPRGKHGGAEAGSD